MKRHWILGFICLWISCAAAAQQASPPPAPKRTAGASQSMVGGLVVGKWWKNSSVVRTLGLSDAQISQLEAIYLKHMDRLVDLRSSVLQEDKKFKSLLEAEQLNEGAITSQRAILAAARAALEAENSDMTLEMRRVLTAVQWRRLETLPPPPPPPPPRPVRSPQEVSSVAEDKVYDVKNTPGIQEPVAEYMPLPAYTPEARAARIVGTIVLQVIIRKDGSVRDVKVLRGLGYGMDEATIQIITTKWRFRPGMLNSQPVVVSARVEVSFRLG